MNDYPVQDLAHQIILSTAVERANMDARKPWYLGGEIFKLPNTFQHLEIWYDPQQVAGAIATARARYGEVRSEDEIYALLAEIVRDAVQVTIQTDQESGEAFGALIVNKLRNYNADDFFAS